METADVVSLVDNLEDHIDELEENIEPLLTAALATTTQKLPLLDQAKLYVVVVYAIESLLFSYLRLNGVKAQEHPIFKELSRVKQYFGKIKTAEAGPTRPRENLSLNKEGAARVIKHALASNRVYQPSEKRLERAEKAQKVAEKVAENRINSKKRVHEWATEKLLEVERRRPSNQEMEAQPQADELSSQPKAPSHSKESSDESDDNETGEDGGATVLSTPEAPTTPFKDTQDEAASQKKGQRRRSTASTSDKKRKRENANVESARPKKKSKKSKKKRRKEMENADNGQT